MTAATSGPPTESPPQHDSLQHDNLESNSIPIEIVSEDEMALLEAALASATAVRTSLSSSLFSSRLQKSVTPNVRAVRSISVQSKKRLARCSTADIEDCPGSSAGGDTATQRETRAQWSFFDRFRGHKGLTVTDITSTEWCEKQMEFVLLFGKKRTTRAMNAGIARHKVLEEEVVKRVEIRTKTAEDIWALRFLNFITGTNQLFFDGLTRELPVIGFIEGVWMLGVIDEIRMPTSKTDRFAILVDTKTRMRATLPAEPQRRNGRLQLMCYKNIWDNSVNFPYDQFLGFFKLDPRRELSEEIRESAASLGFNARTLDDIVGYYRTACEMLPPAHTQLLLRYELQKDHTLIGEDQFEYNLDWLKDRIMTCLEFWRGEREANYTPDQERWKCGHCDFASVCPARTNLHAGTPSSPDSTQIL